MKVSGEHRCLSFIHVRISTRPYQCWQYAEPDENCRKSQGEKTSVVVHVFQGVKGAFYNVENAQISREKKTKLGLSLNALRLSLKYFCKIAQFTIVNGHRRHASCHVMHRAVPQGIALSPTLFKIPILNVINVVPETARNFLSEDDICKVTTNSSF